MTDLELARARADGRLPGDGEHRAVRDRPREGRRDRVAVAVDPRQSRAAAEPLGSCPAILKLFDAPFGPYPFSQVGAVIDDAPDVGYALETQTRPIFDRAPGSSRSRTRSRTSGSATASASSAGRTCGSTRASPPGPSGAGPRTRGRDDRRAVREPARRARQVADLEAAAGGDPRRRRSCSPPGSTSAAGWRSRPCARRSATTRSTRRCATGSRLTPTATPRSTTSSPSPSSTRARTSTASFRLGSSMTASREPQLRPRGRIRDF